MVSRIQKGLEGSWRVQAECTCRRVHVQQGAHERHWLWRVHVREIARDGQRAFWIVQ